MFQVLRFMYWKAAKIPSKTGLLWCLKNHQVVCFKITKYLKGFNWFSSGNIFYSFWFYQRKKYKTLKVCGRTTKMEEWNLNCRYLLCQSWVNILYYDRTSQIVENIFLITQIEIWRMPLSWTNCIQANNVYSQRVGKLPFLNLNKPQVT